MKINQKNACNKKMLTCSFFMRMAWNEYYFLEFLK